MSAPIPTIEPAPPYPHVQLGIPVALARFYPPADLRRARAWVKKHPKLAPGYDGDRVYPDPAIQKIQRELDRMGPVEVFTPKPDDRELSDDEVVDEGEQHQSVIAARLDAATLPEKIPPQPLDNFMSDADAHLEPYLAYCDGMGLGKVVKRFGIADIRRVLDAMEQTLGRLEREEPGFDRAAFLEKARRAVEIRQRDAAIGAQRASAERAAFTSTPPEPESLVKRGREWASADHIYLARPGKVSAPTTKKDSPWAGSSQPAPEPLPVMPAPESRAPVESFEAANERMDRYKAMNERPLGGAVSAIKIPPSSRERRCRELERGLGAILDTVPFHRADGSVNEERRELIAIVDLARAGRTDQQIADELGLGLRTLQRRIGDIKRAREDQVAA